MSCYQNRVLNKLSLKKSYSGSHIKVSPFPTITKRLSVVDVVAQMGSKYGKRVSWKFLIYPYCVTPRLKGHEKTKQTTSLNYFCKASMQNKYGSQRSRTARRLTFYSAILDRCNICQKRNVLLNILSSQFVSSYLPSK